MCKLAILLATACLALPAAESTITGAGTVRQHVRDRVDTNHDGAVSADEKAAVRAEIKAKLAKFDSDGDGKLSETERTAARAALAAKLKAEHPKLLARIDSDGDGTITKEEMQAVRATLRAHRAGRTHASAK